LTIPQVEILGELKASVNILLHLAVDARYKLRERKPLRKRFLQRETILKFSCQQATLPKTKVDSTRSQAVTGIVDCTASQQII